MKERHQRIYDILKRQGTATVEQLKKELYASDATIRRDLTKMEQDGLLVRIWGGAMLKNSPDGDPPAFLRSTENVVAKQKIASAALKLVQENSSIFLMSGTTVLQFAKLLHGMQGLTAITTSLDIVNELNKSASIKVICCGGELYEHYDFTGALTANTLEQFHADYFITSCSGITAEGCTSQDASRVEIMRRMRKNSEKMILLIDSSKVGKKHVYKWLNFDQIDYVVMDKYPKDRALLEKLKNKLIVL